MEVYCVYRYNTNCARIMGSEITHLDLPES